VTESTEPDDIISGASGKMVPIEQILQIALENNASDIHLKAKMQPVLRIDGNLRAISSLPAFSAESVRCLVHSLITPAQKKVLEENFEVDISIDFPGKVRVRASIYSDIDAYGCAMRLIPLAVPSMNKLGLPAVLKTLTQNKSGLILVTGVTGAGKSTTLAAMINEINRSRATHIYTIEDPIEFVYQPVCSLITQREVGFSTLSFARSVRSALRADPNVLLIGEMRDAETVTAALNAAETGLLVFSTLHTGSAPKTIQRILGMFEPKDHETIRSQLANALRAVICQQLVPLVDGGRIALHEIMVVTPSIQEAIMFNEFDRVWEYIKNGAYDGMCTMDDSLFKVYSSGLIDGDVAQAYALNKDEMSRVLRGAHS